VLEGTLEKSLPAKTAGYLTLPAGNAVWVQTLNSLHKEDSDKRARRFAQSECRTLLKGGDDYDSMVLEIRDLSADAQATLIAGDSYWEIHQQSFIEHPEPEEPEQGEMNALEFTEAHVAWEAASAEAEAARKAFESERFEATRAVALLLPVKDRRERCQVVCFNRDFIKAYTRRMRFETLFRAVRTQEDHLKRYYASVDEIEDADDATQVILWSFYGGLEIPQSAVPTSPAQ
jgi:hypothetical protein